MVLNPSESIEYAANFYGVLLDIPFDIQFAWFRRIVPNVRHIAVLYSELSEKYVHGMEEVAEKMDLDITEIKFSGMSGLSREFATHRDHIDGLLAIPDGNIYNKIITSRIIYLAIQQRIPFMGLSKNFTRAGALFSLDCDYKDIGRQAANMTCKVLSGEVQKERGVEYPRRIVPVINLRTARLLGITVDSELQKEVITIDR
jgi:putative ABC transport system substrate-binding protein